MRFLWPEMLWLLALIPALVAAYVVVLRRRKRTAVRGRRKPGGHHRGSAPAAVQAAQTAQVTSSGDEAAVADDPQPEHEEQALPLDGLTHAPATASSPSAAHLVSHRSGGAISQEHKQEHKNGPGSEEAAKSLDEPAGHALPQPELAQQSPGHVGIKHEGIKQEEAKPTPREAARKTGRPKVPAWDEIMFGSRPGAGRSSP